ncbi:MAG: VCBS repeat-containing protein [Planctomycetes bacterium]|nr:VCBS repeat-containing protein [Planctomycetota bacterium]
MNTSPAPSMSYRRIFGNGAWQDPPPFNSVGAPWITYNYPIAAADVDGDGHTDIFVSRGEASPPAPWPDQLWMGDGLGGFTESVGRLPSQPTQPVQLVNQSAVFFDVDRDGDQDLLLCSDPNLLVYENDGSGYFTDVTATRIVSSIWARCLLVLDADLDGDLDVMAGGSTTELLQNDGTGVFTPILQNATGYCEDLFAVDMDRDGHDDVLAIYVGMQQVYLAAANASVLTPAPQLLPNQGVNWSGHANAVIDFDGDGDLDCYLGAGYFTSQLWENTPTGMVDVSPLLLLVSQLSTSSYPFVADYDLDGDMDLFLGVTPLTRQQIVYSSTVREAVTTASPVRGAPYTVDFYAQAGHVMTVALGLGETNVLFPGIGRIYLDPAVSVILGALNYPSRGPQPYTVTIPNLPWIVGMTIGMQGLDIDPLSGEMHTTNCPFEAIQ